MVKSRQLPAVTDYNDRTKGAPDLDPDPDPAGSKQSGSGQPDSLPCSSTNHCKHKLFCHPMSGKCKIFK